MKKYIIISLILVLSSLVCFLYGCSGCRTTAINPIEIRFFIDGEQFYSQTLNFGDKIDQPQLAEREGFIFKGWYKTQEYIEKWDFDTEVVKDNIILYGFWISEAENYYNVLFYDGTELIKHEKVLKDATVSQYSPNLKEGYIFRGWYIDNNIFDFSTCISEDISLSAKWETQRYSVKFIADGIIVNEYSYTVENRNINIPEIPEKIYYDGQWEDFNLTLGNVEISAIYTPIIYTATYIVDDSIYREIEFTIEDKITIPDIPKKAGYTGNWSEMPIPGNNYLIVPEYSPITYTIYYIANGKTVTREYTVENKDVTPPDVPEKFGYIGAWEEIEIDIGNKTINALYTLREYKVTFITDNSSIIVTYNIYNIDDFTVPDVPHKDGFIANWEHFALSYEDITVSIIYTPID